MNNTPHPDPRDQLHTRVTAWLLGELPPPEAAAMAERVRRDRELALLADQLRHAIGLLRAASANPSALSTPDATAMQAGEPLQLANERREKLLAHFKTLPLPQPKVAVADTAARSRQVFERVMLYGAALACVLVLASLLLPATAKSKAKAFHIKLAAEAKQRELELRLAEVDREAGAVASGATASRRMAAIELPAAETPDDFATFAPAGRTGGSALPTPLYNTVEGDGRYETRVYKVEPKSFVDAIEKVTGTHFDQVQGGGSGSRGVVVNRSISPDASIAPALAGQAGKLIGTTIAGTPIYASKPPPSQANHYNDCCSCGGPAEPARPLATPVPARPQISQAAPQRRAIALGNSVAQEAQKTPPITAQLPLPKIRTPATPTGTTAGQSAESLLRPAGTAGIKLKATEPLSENQLPILGRVFRTNGSAGTVTVQPADGYATINGNAVATTEPSLKQAALQREVWAKEALVTVERGWILANQYTAPPPGQPLQPASPAKRQLLTKLSDIRVPEFGADTLPLVEVLHRLQEAAKEHDPQKRGVNLILMPATNAAPVVHDAITGAPALDENARRGFQQLDTIAVKLDPPLLNVRLADVLSAITKVADSPITFSVEDYGVVIRPAAQQSVQGDPPPRPPAANAPVPQPEVFAADNAFSTFSLNVSDVSFQLAAASLAQGRMPDAATVRAEEFLNAFDLRDPEPPPGAPLAFASERARHPFAHNRDLLRLSLKTAALGRAAGQRMNLVLVLDNSGSMERADRVRIVHEAMRALGGLLNADDRVSVIGFARTAHLWMDGAAGDLAGGIPALIRDRAPQGGTNLEEALRLGYETALRHFIAGGINHVVLLTDGAANLGDVDPASLQRAVATHRQMGIALDCFGVGWEGFNDDLLEVLARNGDGRYGFLNSTEEAETEFAERLAGALHVAAADVKVQVEFNPRRVTAWRQLGYAKHQLTKEQFRDNAVDAAELAAKEAGNALYTVEINPAGDGPLATVRARFRVPDTGEYREHSWEVPFTGGAPALDQSAPPMRLAAAAALFAEWLVASPFADDVTPDALAAQLRGVPELFGADPRPRQLEEMLRQAGRMAGR